MKNSPLFLLHPFKGVLLMLLMAAGTHPLFSQEKIPSGWHHPASPWRLVYQVKNLSRLGGAYLEIPTGKLCHPAGRDIYCFDDNGTPMRVRPRGVTSGGSLLVQVHTAKGQTTKKVFAYFGSKTAHSPDPIPEAPLVKVYALSQALPTDNAKKMQERLASAKLIGCAIPPENLALRGNPADDTENTAILLSLFLNCPREQTFSFFFCASDAGLLLLDGKEILARPGIHEFWENCRGEDHTTLSLKKGLHPLQMLAVSYKNVISLAPAVFPSNPAGAPRFLFPEEIVTAGKTQVLYGECRDPSRSFPGFAYQHTRYAQLDNKKQTLTYTEFRALGKQPLEWLFEDGYRCTGRIVKRLFLTNTSQKVYTRVLPAQNGTQDSGTAPFTLSSIRPALSAMQEEWNEAIFQEDSAAGALQDSQPADAPIAPVPSSPIACATVAFPMNLPPYQRLQLNKPRDCQFLLEEMARVIPLITQQDALQNALVFAGYQDYHPVQLLLVDRILQVCTGLNLRNRQALYQIRARMLSQGNHSPEEAPSVCEAWELAVAMSPNHPDRKPSALREAVQSLLYAFHRPDLAEKLLLSQQKYLERLPLEALHLQYDIAEMKKDLPEILRIENELRRQTALPASKTEAMQAQIQLQGLQMRFDTLIQAKSYLSAEQALQSWRIQCPEDRFNGHWLLCKIQCMKARGWQESAKQLISQSIRQHPLSPWLPQLELALEKLQRETGDTSAADKQLEHIRKEYPNLK